MVQEHGDVLRAAVEAVCAELMEGEVSAQIGAELGQRRPDDRMTHRNGYRAREWQTRAGTVELQIPKLRRGSYFSSFLEPRRRSEQALLSVVQQAYVCALELRRSVLMPSFAWQEHPSVSGAELRFARIRAAGVCVPTRW